MHDRVGFASGQDVAVVARLHESLLPDSFLAAAGAGLLTVLYRRIDREPGCQLLVARTADRVVGFVAGTEDTRALYRSFVTRDAMPATWALLPYLVRHPSSVVHSLETLGYGRPSSVGPEANLPAAELLAMGVVPEARGAGLGGLLIRRLQDAWLAAGLTSARVVVSTTNSAAIAAYSRAGFATSGQLDVHKDRPSQVMVWG